MQRSTSYAIHQNFIYLLNKYFYDQETKLKYIQKFKLYQFSMFQTKKTDSAKKKHFLCYF